MPRASITRRLSISIILTERPVRSMDPLVVPVRSNTHLVLSFSRRNVNCHLDEMKQMMDSLTKMIRELQSSVDQVPEHE